MNPIKRNSNLILQEVGNELIIFDQENYQTHSLNHIATLTWKFCTGENSISEIIQLVENDLDKVENVDHQNHDLNDLVYYSLEELDQLGLIRDFAPDSQVKPESSRRSFMKKVAQVGGYAVVLPLITTITAPAPADAASVIVRPVDPPNGPTQL